MISILKNNDIRIKIDSLGAELKSLVTLNDGVEMLWQGNPAYWANSSPILFPIVGFLIDDTYFYEGKIYTLKRHGFAKEIEFEQYFVSESKAVFRLSYNSFTLENYPFKFQLEVSYEIENNSVKISYDVKNLDIKNIYFSIGAHPGFNCPIIKEQKMNDYYIEFEKKENVKKWIKKKNCIAKEPVDFLKNERKIVLDHSLFDNGAIILKNLTSNWLAIKSLKSTKQTIIEFNDFPYLGIWSAANNAPMICIEPWHGIADLEDRTGDITAKEGIIELEKNSLFHCEYKIAVI